MNLMGEESQHLDWQWGTTRSPLLRCCLKVEQISPRLMPKEVLCCITLLVSLFASCNIQQGMAECTCKKRIAQ